MPIVRIVRDAKDQRDQGVPHTELTESKDLPQVKYLPRRSQLLASIKDLRKRSATEKLEYSQRLVEKSRRAILETEFRLTKDK
jgi:hypothetical protein